MRGILIQLRALITFAQISNVGRNLAHAVIVHLRECAAGRVNCKFYDFLQLKVFCKCRKCVTNLHAVPSHADCHEQEPSPQECFTTERCHVTVQRFTNTYAYLGVFCGVDGVVGVLFRRCRNFE